MKVPQNALRQVMASVLCAVMSGLPALAAPPSAPDAGQPAGQIKALLPSASRNAQAAKAKDNLAWNDLLQTGPSGRVRAGLLDGSILSLGSDTELRVVRHDAASQQTALEMGLGKLRSKVVKITQPGGKFEVRTPNAVVGVVGTEFFVGYETNRTTVICYSGVVTVTPFGEAAAAGQTQGANSGSSIKVNAGQTVVITSVVPSGGFLSETTPADILRNSMTDTDVTSSPVATTLRSPHTLGNLLWVAVPVVVAGVVIGLVSSKTGTTTPCVSNVAGGKCR